MGAAAGVLMPSIPGYEVKERLGAGGHGEVFRAWNPVLGKEVAIKILHAHISADRTAVSRFITEARAINRVAHRAIVQVFDLEVMPDGRPFIVMELLRGQTLRELLDARGRLPLADAQPILQQIAEAIDAAHHAGVAHRDLKPENVFVLEDGSVKLIDFGLAKLGNDPGVTESGTTLGTPRYMSPEQCRGRRVDHRSDLYSFGALAYHVLTGKAPFDGDALALALHHLNDPPPPPSLRCPELPAQVDAELLHLLAKNPASRPAPLALVMHRMTGSAGARSPRVPTRWVRRAIIAGSALALLGGALLYWPGNASTQPPRIAAAVRPINYRPDGLPFVPWMSPDGKEVVVADRSGVWRVEMTGSARPIPLVDADTVDYASRLRDGRWIVTRIESDGTGTIWLEAPETGNRKRLARGRFAEACRRGDRVAILDHSELSVLELGTAKRSVVARLTDAYSVRWSPDCTRLVWRDNAEHRVFVASSDGRDIQQLPLPRGGTVELAPVAFLDRDTVLYCTSGSDGLELRTHRIVDETASRDAILHRSVANAGSCALAVAGNGRDAVAFVFNARASVATLSLTGGSRPRLIAQGSEMTAVFQDDGHLLVYDGAQVDTLSPVGELPPRYVRAVRIADGRSTRMPACDGSGAMVRRERRTLHARLEQRPDGARLQLLEPAHCKSVDEWILPRPGSWSPPRCAGRTCVIAEQVDGQVKLWRLSPGKSPALVASAEARSALYAPRVAIAPDATRAIVLPRDGPNGPGTVLVFALDGRATTRLHVPGIEAVVWAADAEHVYISGPGIDRRHNPIFRMRLDGTRELLWSSDSMWTAVRDLSDSGTTLALDARAFSVSMLHVALGPR